MPSIVWEATNSYDSPPAVCTDFQVNNSGKSPVAQNMWSEVGKDFGYADNLSMCTSLAVNFKSAYQRYILPYESFLYIEKPRIQPNPVLGTPPKSEAESADVKRDPELANNTPSESVSGSPVSTRPKRQTREERELANRASKRQKRESMNGTPNPSPKKVATEEVKPGENCETCGRGDDGIHMLLCDGCEAGYHIYCLDPPLTAVPKVDWYCSRCLVGTGEFGFEEGGTYSLLEFQEKANTWKSNYFKTQNAKMQQEICSVTEADVEKEFWRLVQDVNDTVEVEYGADVHSSTHGSAFPTLERNPLDPYSADPWNLNNMPLLRDSLLRFIKTDISGMTVPWLYVGMCFSTFCWHNEDHYTYSINYQHFGEAKTWYGIPGSHAIKFEDVMKRAVPELFEQQPDLLLQLVTIFSPERLVKEGVDVFACDQHAGEFVVTFPQAYHAGFNHGFNFNEAVNFALPDWVTDGLSKDCVDRYRMFARQPVFSHDELLITAALYDQTIKTAIWLAPALSEMTQREISERSTFMQAHPEFAINLLEQDVPEEGYMCGKCKTLTYLSQITCKCTSKVTCLEHADDLCECSQANKSLRLRYADEALQSMEETVRDRAKLPGAWQEKFFAMLKEGPTPHIKVLRALLAEGERIPYPIEELQTLRSFVARVNEWIESATPLISKKGITVGRRKSEKYKKSNKTIEADEQAQEKLKEQRQWDYPDKLVAEAKKLAFDSYEIQALQEKSEAIKHWRSEARALMTMPQISIDRCHEIIESGLALNVELPEVRQFVTYVTQLKWLEEARPSFSRIIPYEDVVRMWDAGKACGVPVEALEMHKLDLRRQAGDAWEEQVSKILKADKVPINAVTHALNQSKNVCARSATLQKLQTLLEKAQHMHKEVAAFNERTRDEDYEKRPTLQEYQHLQEKVDLLVTKPQEAEKLSACAKTLNEWIRRGKRIFGKTNAPLDIFGQHLDYVAQRNAACLSLDDIPRDPVEPASREATPDLSQDPNNLEAPRMEMFCMCRQPEAGLMLECDICHEWYHGKCLKIAKKDLKTTNKYVCPICDWREEIPRASNRPKLEEMQALERDGRSLPLKTPELQKLEIITATAMRYKERVMPLLNSYLTLTSAELSTLKFYLRKLEGAEILLAPETNFFRAKIHELSPVAPTPPPKIDESKSTKRPRLSKKKREELEAQGINPNTMRSINEPEAPRDTREETQESMSRSASPESDREPSEAPQTKVEPYSEPFTAPQYDQMTYPQANTFDTATAQPQFSNVDTSQYESSEPTPAAFLAEAYNNAQVEFDATQISQAHLQGLEADVYGHLNGSSMSANILNSAMKPNADPAQREPDDASYLLDFANQGYPPDQVDEEMIDSFLA